MQNKKLFKKTFSAIVIIALVLSMVISAFPTTSQALGVVTITVKQPDPFSGNYSWFVYKNAAGSIIQDSCTIKNVGNEPATVNVYAVDATSNEAGSFILTFPKDPQKNIGTWTEVEGGPFELNPQQSIDIPFKIHVPDGATPGEYTGGIIVENATSAEKPKTSTASPLLGAVAGVDQIGKSDNISSAGSVSVKTRIGTRIYLTIPGDIVEDVKMTEFSAHKDLAGVTRFRLAIQNDGNMTYEPHATIKIYDTMGNIYETIDESLGTSSPGTTIKPVIKMTKKPFFGNYKAEVRISYESHYKTSMHSAPDTETTQIKFWIIPWEIILIIGLLILIGFAIYIRTRYCTQKYLRHSHDYTVQPNDDLIKLGKTYNIQWKMIAHCNNIKPPYIIKPGQIIKLPNQEN